MSSCESVMEGMPYCFERKATSWSSVMTLWRMRIEPSF